MYDPTITYNDTILIYACTIAGQACLMFLGGKIELRLGPRLAATLGSCLLVGAPLLSSIVTSRWAMTCTFGVLFGFGGGLTYTVPLVCGYRWEPKRKGLVSGVVLSGFGLSALVFNQVQAALVNPGNLKPDVQYKVSYCLCVYFRIKFGLSFVERMASNENKTAAGLLSLRCLLIPSLTRPGQAIAFRQMVAHSIFYSFTLPPSFTPSPYRVNATLAPGPSQTLCLQCLSSWE